MCQKATMTLNCLSVIDVCVTLSYFLSSGNVDSINSAQKNAHSLSTISSKKKGLQKNMKHPNSNTNKKKQSSYLP